MTDRVFPTEPDPEVLEAARKRYREILEKKLVNLDKIVREEK